MDIFSMIFGEKQEENPSVQPIPLCETKATPERKIIEGKTCLCTCTEANKVDNTLPDTTNAKDDADTKPKSE